MTCGLQVMQCPRGYADHFKALDRRVGGFHCLKASTRTDISLECAKRPQWFGDVFPQVLGRAGTLMDTCTRKRREAR